MGELVAGDDGMLVEDVGAWTKDKHNYLRRYIDISRGVRAKYLGPNRAGATYIDPFCGPGRCRVRETGEFIDGGAVTAWLQSRASRSPFTEMYIGDIDAERLELCTKRLLKLGANVQPMLGPATSTVRTLCGGLSKYQLHFAFLDPYSLEALDFNLIKWLSQFKRMDILAHVSEMDLQRNFDLYCTPDNPGLDRFYPGWRDEVDLGQSQAAARQKIIEGWRNKIGTVDNVASPQMKRITGGTNQRLYWLLLLAKHPLAHDFWETAANVDRQGSLDL